MPQIDRIIPASECPSNILLNEFDQPDVIFFVELRSIMSIILIATLAVLVVTFFTLRLLTLCDWDDHD